MKLTLPNTTKQHRSMAVKEMWEDTLSLLVPPETSLMLEIMIEFRLLNERMESLNDKCERLLAYKTKGQKYHFPMSAQVRQPTDQAPSGP